MNDHGIQLPHPLLTEQNQDRQLGNSAEGKEEGNDTDVLFCKRYPAEGCRKHGAPKEGQGVVRVEKNRIDHSSSPAFPKTAWK